MMSDQGNDIHEFNNGVKVYKKHLLKQQLDRYAKINIHEPEEEEWFKKIFNEIDPKNGVFINIGAAGWVPINWSIANETIFQQKEGKSS